MAILPLHPGLEVTIAVDGKQSKEYNAGSDTTVNKRFIEAETGKTFGVNIRFSPPFPLRYAVAAYVTVDDNLRENKIIWAKYLYSPQGFSIDGVNYHVNSRAYLKPFRFSVLKSVEDSGEPLTEDDVRKLQSVGIITVELLFIDRVVPNSAKPQDILVEKKALGTYNEKAAKGNVISHAASEAQSTQEYDRISGIQYVDSNIPFATFHFHYRSLEALKSLDIVPRTPDPPNLMDVDEEHLQTLDRTDLHRMIHHWQRQGRARSSTQDGALQDEGRQQRSQREIQSKKSAIKSEGSDSNIKTEDNSEQPTSRPSKRQKIGKERVVEGRIVIELD
ncbi:unnamed protein product [Periconia digitata]|uniref:DUF7918 domain-containing protein n=1 Tax=Periconia digitata TaxID=1303443 RepID=A0A9W4XM82_9PLEO|nr:unnamed protein product [Periconia digitata]